MEMIVDDKEKMSTLLNSKNVKTLKPYETATGELIPLSGSFNIELLSGESEAMYYMENGEFPTPPPEPKPKPNVEEMQVVTMEAIGEIYALLVMGGLDG